MLKCDRCHIIIQPIECKTIMYSKMLEEICLCSSCNRFISGLITASIDDIIEEYILRKE